MGIDLSDEKIVSWAWTFSPTDGCLEEDEKLIREWMDKHTIGYVISIETAGKRHAHIGILSVRNAKKLFCEWIYKQNPERYPPEYNNRMLVSKTWFRPRTAEEAALWHDHPDQGYGDGWTKWRDYIEKDQDDGCEKHGKCKEEYTQYLAKNKGPDERRKRDPWPEMGKYAQKFKEFKIPHKTYEDVDAGMAQLAFGHKVIKLPDASKLKGFLMYLWKYLQSDGTGTVESIVWHQLENEKKMAIKRKRIDTIMKPSWRRLKLRR